MSNNKYYEETSGINLSALGLGMVLLFFIAIILGYGYGILMYFIPIIYANVFIAVGLGIVLLFCFNWIVKLTKIRGRQSKIILGVVTILFTSYFQWMTFLDTVIFQGFPTPVQYLSSIIGIFDGIELDLFGLLGDIYKYGTWGIGSSGIPISGGLLLLVWIIEIGIIALPIGKSLWFNPVMPFSDKYNKWYPKYTLEDDYQAVISKFSLEEKFSESVVSGIQSLNAGRANSHTKVHLYFLEGEDNHYVSVDKVFIEEQGKGKMKVSSIMQNYRIDTNDARDIQRNFILRNSGNLQIAEFKSFGNL